MFPWLMENERLTETVVDQLTFAEPSFCRSLVNSNGRLRWGQSLASETWVELATFAMVVAGRGSAVKADF